MAKVKGTLLIDFVKTIKADKSGQIAALLPEQDREILAARILPSGWYPYELFKSCFGAVVKVLAQGDMEKVRQWGRLYGEAIITGVYKGMIKQGEPMVALEKYGPNLRNFFDFGEVQVEPMASNAALIRIKGFDPDFKPQYYIMQGWIERSLELSGAKEIKAEVVSSTWQGAPETVVKISWKM